MMRSFFVLVVVLAMVTAQKVSYSREEMENAIQGALQAARHNPSLSDEDIVLSFTDGLRTPPGNDGEKKDLDPSPAKPARIGETRDRGAIINSIDAVLGSLDAGCYVKTPSGCPGQSSFAAWHYTRDTWGEQHKNAANDQNACLHTRKSDYNHWCGAWDTVMHWVAPDVDVVDNCPKSDYNMNKALNKAIKPAKNYMDNHFSKGAIKNMLKDSTPEPVYSYSTITKKSIGGKNFNCVAKEGMVWGMKERSCDGCNKNFGITFAKSACNNPATPDCWGSKKILLKCFKVEARNNHEEDYFIKCIDRFEVAPCTWMANRIKELDCQHWEYKQYFSTLFAGQ
jgi:hypothetical protein